MPNDSVYPQGTGGQCFARPKTAIGGDVYSGMQAGTSFDVIGKAVVDDQNPVGENLGIGFDTNPAPGDDFIYSIAAPAPGDPFIPDLSTTPRAYHLVGGVGAGWSDNGVALKSGLLSTLVPPGVVAVNFWVSAVYDKDGASFGGQAATEGCVALCILPETTRVIRYGQTGVEQPVVEGELLQLQCAFTGPWALSADVTINWATALR